MASIGNLPLATVGDPRSGVNPIVQRPSAAIPFNVASKVFDHFAKRAYEDEIAVDRLTAVKAEADHAQQVATAMDGLDPLATDYTDRVKEIAATTTSGVLEGYQFKHQAVLDDLQGTLGKKASALSVVAIGTRREAIEKESVLLFGQALEGLQSKIAQDPAGALAYRSEFDKTAGALRGGMSSIQILQADEMVKQTFASSVAIGLAQQGDYKGASKWATANRTDMGEDVYNKVVTDIRGLQTAKETEFLKSMEGIKADMRIGIDTGETTLSSIKEAVAMGVFENDDKGRSSITRAVIQRDKAAAKEANEVREALALYSSGGLITQGKADKAFDALGVSSIEGLADFTRNSGFLPTVAKNVLDTADNSADPAKRAAAAEAVLAIRKANPNMAFHVGDNLELTIAVSKTFETPMDKAATFVINQAPDPQTRKNRVEDAKEVFKEIDPSDYLDFDATKDVAREFKDRVQLNYQFVGDEAIAIEATKTQMKEMYGETNVGGVTTTVKLPPELNMGGTGTPDENRELIEQDLIPTLKTLGIVPETVKPGVDTIWSNVLSSMGQNVNDEKLNSMLAERENLRRTRAEALWTHRHSPDLKTIRTELDKAEQQLNDKRRKYVQGKPVISTTKPVDESGLPAFSLVADEQTVKEKKAGLPLTYRVQYRNRLTGLSFVPDANNRNLPLRYQLPDGVNRAEQEAK